MSDDDAVAICRGSTHSSVPLITVRVRVEPLRPHDLTILSELRAGVIPTTHLSTTTGISPRRVRQIIEKLEHRGFVIRKTALGWRLVWEPQPGGKCIRCGAEKRKANTGPYCAPCERAVENEDFDYHPQDDPEFLDHLKALFSSRPHGEPVDLYGELCILREDTKYVQEQVDLLRSEGWNIRGLRSGIYHYYADEK